VNVLHDDDEAMRAFKVITDPKGFDVIGDKTRRRIIYLLRARDLSVSQIAEQLQVTPQAIYHHIKKLLGSGMVEVAKEERIGHFIETYYRATAEVFDFHYGECETQKVGEDETKEAVRALERVGFVLKADDETISKYVKLVMKIESAGANPEIEDKLAQMTDVGFFGAQHARKLSRSLSMTDRQFDEYQALEREARAVLKSKLLENRQVIHHPLKATR
jgi:DNA-binding transcriptional ArsR family regulator